MPDITIWIVALAIITLAVVYLARKWMKNKGQEAAKENKPMFWLGMAVVAVSIIFFIVAEGEFEGKIWAIPIWIVGIGLVANSRYRLIK